MYSQEVALNEVVHTLNQAGFDNEDICMMLSPTHPIAALVRDASLFNSECASNAVTAGLIGWLSGFGAVLIPTVGFFIRSQAFFRALMVSREAPAFVAMPELWWALDFRTTKPPALRTSWACWYTCPARECKNYVGLRSVAPHRAREAATMEQRLTATAAA